MSDIPRISPAEASAKMAEGWTYVDVRTPQEYEAGHPAGAVNVPIADPAFLRVMRAAFGTEAKIVVGCKAGARSAKAALALAGDGFKNILDQRAGWDGARNPFGQVTEGGWVQAGLPQETGAPAGRGWTDMLTKAR